MNKKKKVWTASMMGRKGGKSGIGEAKVRPLSSEEARRRVMARWNRARGAK